MQDHERFKSRNHGCLVIVLAHMINVSAQGVFEIPKLDRNGRAVCGSFSKEVSV